MSGFPLLTDPSALGFIISPWSLLLMPSGNISFTDENVTQQDLGAFTAPEVLEGLNLSSVSDIEKVWLCYVLGSLSLSLLLSLSLSVSLSFSLLFFFLWKYGLCAILKSQQNLKQHIVHPILMARFILCSF